MLNIRIAFLFWALFATSNQTSMLHAACRPWLSELSLWKTFFIWNTFHIMNKLLVINVAEFRVNSTWNSIQIIFPRKWYLSDILLWCLNHSFPIQIWNHNKVRQFSVRRSKIWRNFQKRFWERSSPQQVGIEMKNSR